MRNVAVIIFTAVSLAVGCTLAGYGYSEWWRERPPVLIQGLVWEFRTQQNPYTPRRDVYYGRVPRPEVAVTVKAFDESFADWPQEATIRLLGYRERLPGRIDELGLERLAAVRPRVTVLKVYVEPEVAGSRDRHGMINIAARYVVTFGSKAYLFEAANEWEAEIAAKSVVERIIEDHYDGSYEKLIGGTAP